MSRPAERAGTGTREELLRRRIWRGAGCGAVFWICCHCDRGHRYCGERCRQKKRRQQRRDANRRHQQSPEGRLDHRDRQRAYRERCRHRARVTDQPYVAVFRAARMEQARLLEQGAVLKRIRIDAELKREIARATETARARGSKEAADAVRFQAAEELGLPVKDGRVEYPDAQLEYSDLEGRSGRVNVEIATEHYSVKSIGAKAAAGFAVHGNNGRASARVARSLGQDRGGSGGSGGGRDKGSIEL